MSYAPWSSSLVLLSDTSFASRAEVRGFLRRVSSLQLSVKANRDSVREELNALGETGIFGQRLRFPEGVFYVHLESKRIQTALMAIRNSLDNNDRVVEVQGAPFDSRGWQDSKRVFEANISLLTKILSSTSPQELATNGVYEQTTFESSFRANWVP